MPILSDVKRKSLDVLREILLCDEEWSQAVKEQAEIKNPWFTRNNIDSQFLAIAKEYLDPEKISAWLEQYPSSTFPQQNIGIIMAGNIPLVGFHDLLCTIVLGHRAVIKLSEKDSILLPNLVQRWFEKDRAFQNQIVFSESLKKVDALLATGSNNTQRYFEYYFRSVPRLLRNSRNGVAILPQYPTSDEIDKLLDDIFLFFGLGCRSVSKVFIPKGFQLDQLFTASLKYQHLINHPKYKNNYDYNLATMILNRENYQTNGLILIKEEKMIPSRIATLHVEYYQESPSVLLRKLETDHLDEIQCVVSDEISSTRLEVVEFGKTQQPKLNQYADNKDTLQFLINTF